MALVHRSGLSCRSRAEQAPQEILAHGSTHSRACDLPKIALVRPGTAQDGSGMPRAVGLHLWKLQEITCQMPPAMKTAVVNIARDAEIALTGCSETLKGVPTMPTRRSKPASGRTARAAATYI